MATLLELVRKHVKVWPDGIALIKQNTKGVIYGAVRETGAPANPWHEPAQIADDRAIAGITREQWEGMCIDEGCDHHGTTHVCVDGNGVPNGCGDEEVANIGRGLLQPVFYDIGLDRRMIGREIRANTPLPYHCYSADAGGQAVTYAAIFGQGFELPHESGIVGPSVSEACDRVNISRNAYELLHASRRAWLSVMQALDETHPDWATGTNKGTLVERAVKAIKNGN